MRWKLVVVESPYGSKKVSEVERNIDYAMACVRDCLLRNESPIASHLLLTQAGILDDNDPYQRDMGVEAGNAWIAVADAVVVYTDLGISVGMRAGITVAEAHRKDILYRSLNGNNRRYLRDPPTASQDKV